MERPYKLYITRHPTALQHLQNLPQTPALTTYLAYTRTVASSLSHAWDLSSLLIKPVQRLLKYPLLLAAIIDETPDGHPDKENLRDARSRMEEVARNVNEGRRRAEVVKDVLTSKTPKKPNASVGVAASVNLSKMKSLRHGGVTAATMRVSQLAEGTEAGNSEAAKVEAMQAELKRLDDFAQLWAKNVVDWGKMMSNVMLSLRNWALSFGKVIGLSADQGSEAFDAFVEVVQKGLLPLASDLEVAINERLLKDLAHLLMSMVQPLKLLTSMNEQEPYHYHLLTMPVSTKNRPPPSLLAASTNYLALRGQLAAELPTYIALMHRGLAGLVRRLADIQVRFWTDVKDRWAELWEMLRVEGELNVGSPETSSVWCARWADVDEVVTKLGITNPVQHITQAQLQKKRVEAYLQSQESVFTQVASPPAMFYSPAPLPLSPPAQSTTRDRHDKHNSRSSTSTNSSSGTKSAVVQNMFGSLESTFSSTNLGKEKSRPSVNVAATVTTLSALNPSLPSSSSYPGGPASASSYSVSAPLPLGAAQMYGHTKEKDRDRESKKSRPRGVSDVDPKHADRGLRRTNSQDSRRKESESVKSTSSSRRRTHGHFGMADDFAEYVTAQDHHQHHQRQHHQQPERQFGGGLPGPMPGGLPPTYDMQTVSSKAIPRTKSMPLGHITAEKSSSSRTNGTMVPQSAGGYVMNGDQLYYQIPADEWEEWHQQYGRQHASQQQQQQQQVDASSTVRERGRRPSAGRSQTTNAIPTTTPSSTATARAPSPTKRKSKERERPPNSRKRSGSVKSITSFFTGGNNSSSTPPDPQPLTASQRDSWVSKPAKYICQVIHECKPPASVSYYSFPFFTLKEGEFYEVLQEAGHPSIHPKLPLYVDDGEDCLLLCRDGNGLVGWALASFLEPLSLGS